MNKRASEYLEELVKEAGSVGSVNWGKQKEIPVYDYSVRDAKLGEKIMHGAKEAGKGATKAGKDAISMGKKVLSTKHGRAFAGGVAATTALALAADAKANKKREKSVTTNWNRDSLVPDMGRNVKTAPIRMGTAVAALAVGSKGAKVGEHLGRRAVIKGGIKGVDAAEKIIRGAGNTGLVAGTIGTAVAGGLLEAKTRQNMAVKKLDKLSNKYLGREATQSEKNKIKEAYPLLKNRTSMITPETEVQKRRRQKDKREKRASEYLEAIYKEAGDKWSKEDKKGYVRNVAISAAQDFMNAGNPLNIGSSVVGSIADSALLEGISMKMNKKLQANKISEKKVNNFNKAVEAKNGVALPHAIDNKTK